MYTALQCIFDAVNVSPEEVYRIWQVREIDVAPQLLVNVRRARKERKLKVRQAMLAMAHSKDRKSSFMKNKVMRAFMSSIKEDHTDENQGSPELRSGSTIDISKDADDVINLASISTSVHDGSPKRLRSKTESFDFSVVSESEVDTQGQSNMDEDEFDNADVDDFLQ